MPAESQEKDVLEACPLAPGGLLAILGVPWLVDSASLSLCLCVPDILPVCGCVQTSFTRTKSYWLRGPPSSSMTSS